MVQIDNRMEQPLPASINKVLKVMFNDYQKAVVKSEFTSGRSGSHVFLVRPLRQDGVPELPSIVKIDYHERIEQEWQAYNRCIKNRLPGVAEISGEPTYPRGSQWGGLRYPLIGSSSFDIVSFHDYCLEADTDVICYVLEKRLFKSLDALWKQKDVQPELHLHTYYDSFLPANLQIEYTPSLSGSPRWLEPETAQTQTFSSGDAVQLSNFSVVKILKESATLVLDIPSGTSGAYRLQIEAVPGIDEYEVGQVIHQPLSGKVKQTRTMELRTQATNALGTGVNLTANTFTFTNGTTLPNPLIALPRLLSQSLDAYVACIHADLNLQNILVEPQNRNAYLIDFVNARQDHILRDLLHLEMAIVTRLIPRTLTETTLVREIMTSFYERLHCVHFYPDQIIPPAGLEKPFAILKTIRWAARHYLFEPDNWAEYYYGLIFYLLGALRYKDLDAIPTAKQVAFWGAAVTQKLLETSPPCAEMLVKQVQDGDTKGQQEKRRSESNRLQIETHFHSPVIGPVHTGSGNINVTGTGESEESALGSETETKTRYRDTLSSYEIGTQRLLAQMGRNHPRYLEALGYQDRLRDNIDRSRRFGDTSLRKADRAEIVEQLNELSLSETGISFNEMCQGTG